MSFSFIFLPSADTQMLCALFLLIIGASSDMRRNDFELPFDRMNMWESVLCISSDHFWLGLTFLLDKQIKMYITGTDMIFLDKEINKRMYNFRWIYKKWLEICNRQHFTKFLFLLMQQLTKPVFFFFFLKESGGHKEGAYTIV